MSTYLQGIPDYLPQIQATAPNLQLGMQALKMKQSAYDSNKKQLSNLYGSLLNSPMMRSKNIEDRDKFFKTIDQDIKKLSGMDLSLEQNAVAGSQLFNQLTDNKDIVKDMAWTKNWQNEQSRFDNLKGCTDPKKCNELWWEGGATALNFKAEEFRNATDEEALGMANAKAVGAVDLTRMATEMADTADLNVTLDTLSGNYIYTTKNGKNVEPAMRGLLDGYLGNNEAAKAYMTEKAYVQRKSFVKQAVETGQFESEELAERDYFGKVAGAALAEAEGQYKEVKSQLDSTTALLAQTKSKVEKLPANSPLRKQYQDLLNAQGQLQQSATVYETRIADSKSFANQGFSKNGLKSLDRSIGGQMLSQESARLANTLSYKNAEQTMTADDFALENARSNNRIKEENLKQKAEADAAAAAQRGEPEANNFTTSKGEVDVTTTAYEASEQIQKVLQDNDVDLINAANVISTKIVEDSFNTMKQNVSGEDKIVAENRIMSLLNQVYGLYGDNKNVSNPNVKGGFTEFISSDPDNALNKKGIQAGRISEKWSGMNDAQKKAYINRIGQDGVMSAIKMLSVDGNDQLFNDYQSKLANNENIDPLFAKLRNDVNVKSALSAGQTNQRANAAFDEWMGNQRASVIDKYRLNKDGGTTRKSEYLEAAVDEDGQIKSYGDYLTSYIKNATDAGKTLTGEDIGKAVAAYIGRENLKKTGSEYIAGQFDATYGQIWDVLKESLSKWNRGIIGAVKDIQELISTGKIDMSKDFEEISLDRFVKGHNPNLTAEDLKNMSPQGGIAAEWKEAFGKYGELSENNILRGIGSMVNKTVSISQVDGAAPQSQGFLALRDFAKDIRNEKNDTGDVIYSITGSKEESTAEAKSIFQGLMTNLLSQTSDKKSDRPIVDYDYNNRVKVGDETYTKLTIRMNPDYINKQSKIEGDTGTNFQEMYNLSDEDLKKITKDGLTVYLKADKANNKLHEMMSKTSLQHALDFNGSIEAYNDSETGSNLKIVKGSGGRTIVQGSMASGYDPETDEYIYKAINTDVTGSLNLEESIKNIQLKMEKIKQSLVNSR